MKELDFDELDKAVNSLMSNVGKETLPDENDDNNVRTVTLPSDADGQPSTPPVATPANPTDSAADSTPAPQPAAAAPAPSSPTPPVASKRTGRFMDVVHPSSSVRPVDSPAKAVSREGAMIQPTVSPVSTDEPAPLEVDPTPAPDTTPTTEQPAVTEPTVSAPGVDWPDPIDMHKTEADDTPETDSSKVDQPEEPTPASEEPAPLTSPFLTDAKVEKRPLGGVPSNEVEADAGLDAKPDTTLEPRLDDAVAVSEQQADKSEAADKSDEIVQPLPPELQEDLVALESDGSTTPNKNSGETAESDKPSDDKIASPAAATTAAAAVSGSIPQQYKEEPSTSDEKNGAIYDTEAYHQPLTHPAKKKSGWLWVLWIVLILLLGAGAGAGVYFLGLV